MVSARTSSRSPVPDRLRWDLMPLTLAVRHDFPFDGMDTRTKSRCYSYILFVTHCRQDPLPQPASNDVDGGSGGRPASTAQSHVGGIINNFSAGAALNWDSLDQGAENNCAGVRQPGMFTS